MTVPSLICRAADELLMREEKPSVPEVVPLLRRYYEKHGNCNGGSLHIVTEDYNVRDSHVESCICYAIEHGDGDGVGLALLFRRMSRTQRLKASRER